jgi:CRP-like cAMP-binding protein
MVEVPTLALLRHAPVFEGLDERALSRLLAGSVARQVGKGGTLFAEGEAVASAPLLLSGKVALTASGTGGQKTVLALLGEGDFVAVPPLLLGLPSPVGAVATMPTRLLSLDLAALRATLHAEPVFADAIVAMLARHWCGLIAQMKDLKLHDSRTRVARWLVENATGAAVTLAAPKGVLARHLGMTPESFSRALASLEAAGAIEAAGSSISILDRGLLEHLPGR